MEASENGGVRDQVQKAIDDLRAAGEKATGDVRSGIDSAVAPSVSTRLRLVWWAAAFWAVGRRRTSPE